MNNNQDATDFQKTVSEYLIRHRSVLDVLSKLQETNARVHRAVSKSVTACGCVKISASKQKIPSHISLFELKNYVETHLEGKLCQHCLEVLEAEVGSHLFYLAALLQHFGLDLLEIMALEQRKVSTLGVFHLT